MNDTDAPAIDVAPESTPVHTDAGESLDVDARLLPREIDATTKALMAKAAAELANQFKAGEAVDEFEPVVGAETVEAAAPETVPESPAPSAEPSAAEQQAQLLAGREQELADREAKLAEREKALSPRENLRMRYAENPAAVIAELIKEATGSDDSNELADAISELSTKLGLELNPAHKAQLESKRSLRQTRAYAAEAKAREERLRAELSAKEQELAKRQAEIDRAPKVEQAKQYVKAELAKLDVPFLLTDDAPHETVWAEIKSHYDRTGEALEPDVIAKKINDERAKLFERLSKAKKQTAPTANQGGAPQNPRAATLTNKATTAPTTPKPAAPVEETEFSNEDKRRSSYAAFQRSVAEREARAAST